MDPYESDWLQDFTRRRGVLVDTDDYEPLDYFKLFFPDGAFQLLCDQTNQYATQYIDGPVPFPTHSRFRKWEATTVSEMQAYVALQIAMGLCQKHELEDYWGTYWLTYTPFTDIMSRDRYELLTSFLHFADNAIDRPVRGEPGYEPLWKVKPLMDICEPTYLATYGPRSELSIDESIIKFKGRVHFRQYLPSKPTRWGIKQFALCESKTGYALKFITYCGKNTIVTLPGFSITETICLSLLDGFTNCGHKVFTDNFYTSPTLYKKLHDDGTGACGTVKAGRKHMPPDLHPKRLHLDKGDDPVFMLSGNMISCAWHDTKRVHFLSTINTNLTCDKRIRARGEPGGHRTIEKPVVAEVYNQHMGGVDIMDQKLGTFGYPHKSSKWYFTIYHRIREVALVNAYIIYVADSQNRPRNQIIPPRVFRERVIQGLLEGHARKPGRRGRPSITDQPLRLVERHSIGQYDDPKYKPDCIVCSDREQEGWKRKQTIYKCKQCRLPMCFMPCHEIYHNHNDFRQQAAHIVYNL